MNRSFLIAILFLLICFQTPAQNSSKPPYSNPNALVDTFKKSISCRTSGKIGPATVTINYYSPGVKKRIIWGGLVPYNQVWVTGAHSATNITISKSFVIGGKKIPAGTYALFTIPGEKEWIFILNKNYEQHLTDEYSEEQDLVRLKVKPLPAVKQLERLEYFIEKEKVVIAWEKLKIEVPVAIKN